MKLLIFMIPFTFSFSMFSNISTDTDISKSCLYRLFDCHCDNITVSDEYDGIYIENSHSKPAKVLVNVYTQTWGGEEVESKTYSVGAKGKVKTDIVCYQIIKAEIVAQKWDW